MNGPSTSQRKDQLRDKVRVMGRQIQVAVAVHPIPFDNSLAAAFKLSLIKKNLPLVVSANCLVWRFR